VASNIKNIALDAHTVVMGEVGLGGEVRAVNQVEKRLKEATKLGFKRAVISEQNFKGLESDLQIQLLGVRDIRGALGLLL
jgi:DNA repair protein RadA/Sms